MTNIELYDALVNENSVLFQSLRGAIFKSAIAVVNEASNTSNHAMRLAWGNQCLAIPVAQSVTTMARKMLPDVLTNGDVQTAGNNVQDSLVDYMVASILGTPSILSRY